MRSLNRYALCIGRRNRDQCCKKPTVTAGKYTCNGVKNGQCIFTISQDVCIEVPVEFGATAAVGDTYVACNGASADNICPDCLMNDATDVIPPVVGDLNITGNTDGTLS